MLSHVVVHTSLMCCSRPPPNMVLSRPLIDGGVAPIVFHLAIDPNPAHKDVASEQALAWTGLTNRLRFSVQE
jgi:hypothetical protein